jgi:hypothetical protein
VVKPSAPKHHYTTEALLKHVDQQLDSLRASKSEFPWKFVETSPAPRVAVEPPLPPPPVAVRREPDAADLTPPVLIIQKVEKSDKGIMTETTAREKHPRKEEVLARKIELLWQKRNRALLRRCFAGWCKLMRATRVRCGRLQKAWLKHLRNMLTRGMLGFKKIMTLKQKSARMTLRYGLRLRQRVMNAWKSVYVSCLRTQARLGAIVSLQVQADYTHVMHSESSQHAFERGLRAYLAHVLFEQDQTGGTLEKSAFTLRVFAPRQQDPDDPNAVIQGDGNVMLVDVAIMSVSVSESELGSGAMLQQSNHDISLSHNSSKDSVSSPSRVNGCISRMNTSTSRMYTDKKYKQNMSAASAAPVNNNNNSTGNLTFSRENTARTRTHAETKLQRTDLPATQQYTHTDMTLSVYTDDSVRGYPQVRDGATSRQNTAHVLASRLSHILNSSNATNHDFKYASDTNAHNKHASDRNNHNVKYGSDANSHRQAPFRILHAHVQERVVPHTSLSCDVALKQLRGLFIRSLDTINSEHVAEVRQLREALLRAKFGMLIYMQNRACMRRNMHMWRGVASRNGVLGRIYTSISSESYQKRAKNAVHLWCTHTVLLRTHRRILQRIFGASSYRLLCMCMTSWRDSARILASSTRADSNLRRIDDKNVRKLRRILLQKSVNSWREFVARNLRFKDLGRKVMQRMQNMQLYVGFERWREQVNMLRHMQRTCMKVVARMRSALIVRLFALWLDNASHLAYLRAALARAIVHHVRTLCRSTWQTWVNGIMVKYKAAKIMSRWRALGCARMFAYWAAAVAWKKTKLSVDRRVRLMREKGRKMVFFSEWMDVGVRSRKYANTAKKVMKRWRQSSIALVFACWQEATQQARTSETEDARRRLLAEKFAGKMRKRLVKRFCVIWRGEAAQCARNRAVLQKVVARIKHRGVSMVIDAWEGHTKYSNQLRLRGTECRMMHTRRTQKRVVFVWRQFFARIRTCGKILKRWSSLACSRMFEGWVEMCEKSKRLRNVAGRVVKRWGMLELMVMWQAWSERVLGVRQVCVWVCVCVELMVV